VVLAAFTDYVYHRKGGRLYAERAFALFLASLGDHASGLTIVGRLSPDEGESHYPLPDTVRFVSLPHYASLTRPFSVGASLIRSLHRFWRVLDDADHVWLLGPYPHAVVFAVLTKLRRRRLVLGVRQDFPAYIRSRRPRRRWMHVAADVLETVWRMLARLAPVIVVGPELARHYSRAPALLEITVSLISEHDIEAGERAANRSYAGELQLLSVGRIDREKNPLLLAEILARLRQRDARWRLVVCGEGPMTASLVRRIAELGLTEHAELRGYVPIHGGLLDLYRSSHVFLHVSLTEGMPQVLTEAFASGVPVVATAVGGVADAAGDAALLVPPEEANAPADAVQQLALDAELRNRLIGAGLARVRGHTREAEVARVAQFIAGPATSVPTAARRGPGASSGSS
jgi:glycosyltransferase involved in cell wall biosynthesis